MQVIANNFRGVRNGNSYKIEVQADAGSLTAIYKEDKMADGVYWVEVLITRYYTDLDSYKVALQTCLQYLEEKTGIQLIKAELKVA